MRTPRNSSTASPPPFSQKHLDIEIEDDLPPHSHYQTDDSIECGPVKKDIKIIDLVDSDSSDDEAYDEETDIEETPPKKKKKTTPTPSQGHADKKDPGPECSPTINTSSGANVVTPPIRSLKRGDDDEDEYKKIPENYKFMGHWKNPPPEDMKKGKIYCTIKFNREPWSTKE